MGELALVSLLLGNKKKDNKKQLVIDRVKQIIEENSLQEGDKLPSERELAAMLGVSRNILREAIVSLSTEGVIEVKERQGLYIKNLESCGMIDTVQGLQMLPPDFMAYQLEVRTIISVPAARLAALRRTEGDIQKMRECYDSFVKCPFLTEKERIQSGKWEALLHHLLTEAAHNPILSRINESIDALIERNNAIAHTYLIEESGWFIHIQKQHAEIIDAVERHDAKQAGDILHIHMLESVQMMGKKYPELLTRISTEVLTGA